MCLRLSFKLNNYIYLFNVINLRRYGKFYTKYLQFIIRSMCSYFLDFCDLFLKQFCDKRNMIWNSYILIKIKQTFFYMYECTFIESLCWIRNDNNKTNRKIDLPIAFEC